MSVPPNTQREQADWDVPGEHPTPGDRHAEPDKLGVGLVGAVLLAVLVVAVLLIVL
jgi:hypothetical protein